MEQIYHQSHSQTGLLLLIGAIYYQLGNFEQCIAFNDRCIILEPQMAEAHANLANALQQLGNFDMSIIYYQVSPLPQVPLSADPHLIGNKLCQGKRVSGKIIKKL